MTVLPDVLEPNLDIIFCGTAAGTASAMKRAYYAGPGNAFWSTIHRVGLTPRLLAPEEYVRVTDWKLGLTDLAKHVAGSDGVLCKSHFDAARLRDLIAAYRPHIVAFTGKRAAAEFMGRPAPYGLLPEMVGTTRLFVLPSPSGAARRYWDEALWHDLASTISGPRTRQISSDAGLGSLPASTIATP